MGGCDNWPFDKARAETKSGVHTGRSKLKWSQRQGWRHGYSVRLGTVEEAGLEANCLQHRSGKVWMLRSKLKVAPGP